MIIKISLLYAGILGLLLTILSFNVMNHWVRVTGSGRESDLAMRRAERVLNSFVEYVPLSLILLILIELVGTAPFMVHALGIMLVASRLAHAYGSNLVKYAGAMRFIGSQLAFLMMMISSLACIYFFLFGRV
ncbi:MAG: MAPEG family protein [Alphaproteobacteria bacterium]|nr:MAPEG family protein [Alphaproteobacteria bacterium]